MVQLSVSSSYPMSGPLQPKKYTRKKEGSNPRIQIFTIRKLQLLPVGIGGTSVIVRTTKMRVQNLNIAVDVTLKTGV